MKNEFPFAHGIRETLKIIGFVILFIAVIVILIQISNLLGSPTDERIELSIRLMIYSILAGGLGALILFAISEILYLMMRIEINTRSQPKNNTGVSNGEWENKTNQEWIEWAEKNPGKTINDYYTEVVQK